MKTINTNQSDDGSYGCHFCSSNVPIMPGWAVIPDDMTPPDSFPFVDIDVEDIDGVLTVTKMTAREIPPTSPAPPTESEIQAMALAEMQLATQMQLTEMQKTIAELSMMLATPSI